MCKLSATLILIASFFAMTLSTSCQKEESITDTKSIQDEGYVEFQVSAHGDIATKAISKGDMVDVLYYAVYKNGEELKDLRPSSPIVRGADGRFVFKIKLVKGLKYRIAFWAQSSQCTAYDISDFEAVKFYYDGLANDESRDAFFKAEDVMLTSNTQVTEVVLKRPFAQINFAASDYKVVSQLVNDKGFKSTIALKGVPNTLNLLTGETSGSEDIEFRFNYAPDGEDRFFDGNTMLRYVSMNYILAEKEKRIYSQYPLVGMFEYANATLEIPIYNLPVQRNYRTNIIGSLFSADIIFNLDLEEIFDNNTNQKYPIN